MALTPACDLFVLVGEASGDAYGAAILQALRERHPDLVCAAMGGERLAAAGAEIEQSIDGLAVMGLGPVLARLPEFIRLGLRLQRVVRSRRPKVVLTIDYPGFNLRLVRKLADLRQAGTRFVHVVAPQVWAWKPRRSKAVSRSVDRLLCFFPFEPPLFNRFHERFGIQADFVGHPLVDLVNQDHSGPALAADAYHGKQLLLIAPGSRPREVAALLPVFHKAAELVLPHLGPQVQPIVSRCPDLPLDLYRRHTHFPLVDGGYRALCRAAHGGLIASGTATLEAALCGLPHVIGYHTDRLTAAVARQVVLTRHVGLPNIVADRRFIPEVLQDQLVPERLAQHLLRLWSGSGRTTMLAGLSEVRSKLGSGGAVARMAQAVADELFAGRRRDTSMFAPGSVARSRTEAHDGAEQLSTHVDSLPRR
jgi:lipid-A-disaccharide synthase